MAIGRLCFCSRYFWPSILFLLLNVTSPGNEEKGKTILHRPMSFGFWFANVSSDLRLLLLDGHVCKVRHFGLSFRRRGFLASRVQYYPNSDSRFQLTRVTVSGDIELNPGPTNCSVCTKVIARNHRLMHAVVPCEVRSSEAQGVQTSPANGSVQLDLPSMFFNRLTFC